MRMPVAAYSICTMALLLTATPSTGAEHEHPPAPTSATMLLSKPLEGIPGKETIMYIVELPPGASSPPHRHDAHVFLYVLEGAIVTQIAGQDAVTVHPGQTSYESPSDVHLVFANTDDARPAKVLVVMVKDIGAPRTREVTGAE